MIWQWVLLGFGLGWAVCGACFIWLIPAWREAPDLLRMSDARLINHAAMVMREIDYRHLDNNGDRKTVDQWREEIIDRELGERRE